MLLLFMYTCSSLVKGLVHKIRDNFTLVCCMSGRGLFNKVKPGREHVIMHYIDVYFKYGSWLPLLANMDYSFVYEAVNYQLPL